MTRRDVAWIVLIVGVLIWIRLDLLPEVRKTMIDRSDTVVVSRIDTVHGSIAQPVVLRPTVSIPPIVIPPLDQSAIDSIIREYLTTQFYERTMGDTNAVVTIRDSIRGNRIVWSDSLRYQVRRQIITQTITQTREPSRQLFIGATALVASPDPNPRIVPSVMYLDRRGRGYSLGYSPQDGTKYISLHVRIFGKSP